MMSRCPVCNGHGFFPAEKVFDDRYGEPNSYLLARCAKCGHIATLPRFCESDLPRLYSTYYPRKGIRAENVADEVLKVKSVFAQLVRWWNGTNNQGQYSVRAGETMLDVGCGSGASLLEAKLLGAIPFGIETDFNVQPIAKALGLTIHFGNLKDRPFPGQVFELIVLNQVIEHLPDPDWALQTLNEMLAPNGRMVLAFPNTSSLWRSLFGMRWINWHVPYHLHHFNHKSFVHMVKRCGFEVTLSKTVTPNAWTLMQLRSIFYKPILGSASPIWVKPNHDENHIVMKNRKAVWHCLLRGFALIPLSIINRIIDSFGMGDSILVELQRVNRDNLCDYSSI